MKSDRGFTLIEIMIAIALLGILSMGMLSGLTAQYRLLKRTDQFTVNLGTAQQTMEQFISNTKNELKSGSEPDGAQTYTLFAGTAYERQVTGYPETISLGSEGSLFTVVGSEVLDYPVASITNLQIQFNPTGSTAYIYNSSLYSGISSFTLSDPDNVNLTTIYRWYVSRAGFNIPVPSDPDDIEEVEIGSKYPRFPDDYTIIPSSNTTVLTNIISSYAGRHIICTATPAARSGKMGATKISNPLFISGLPVHDDLVLHLDASMISGTAGDSVSSWNDISGQDNSASSIYYNTPTLQDTALGDITISGNWYHSYARYLTFDSGDQMKAYVPRSGAYTCFVVARSIGDSAFTVYQDDAADDYVHLVVPAHYYTPYVTISPSSSADIAEVILFSSSLSSDDAQAVVDYLKAKYNVEPPVVTIQTLQQHLTAAVTEGDSYTLPAQVPAYMSNGETQTVPVTWVPDTVDTSTPGTYVFSGAATSSPGKTTTLTLTVFPRIHVTGVILSPDTLTIYTGNTGQLTASVLPADATDPSVTWSSSNSAVAAVNASGLVTGVSSGTATITATTTDGGFTDTCEVMVIPKNVTSVSLDKHSITLWSGDLSEQLTASIDPSDADNTNVTWSSSNPTVAAVDGSGNVTAGSDGSATITVTTEDGNHTDTCSVTVDRTPPSVKTPLSAPWGTYTINKHTTVTIRFSEALSDLAKSNVETALRYKNRLSFNWSNDSDTHEDVLQITNNSNNDVSYYYTNITATLIDKAGGDNGGNQAYNVILINVWA